MLCKCGAGLPKGAKFCMECGAKAPKRKPKYPTIADELYINKVDPVLTVKEAAVLLKVSEWMIYELTYQNKIPFFQIGNRKRFRTSELLEWASKQKEITTRATVQEGKISS